MRFPTLQLPFATARFHNCVEFLPIDQSPRPTAACGFGLPALMFCQSNFAVHSRSDIEALTRLAFEDVDGWHVGNLVDLVGIEPTTSSMPWKRAPSCATGPLF